MRSLNSRSALNDQSGTEIELSDAPPKQRLDFLGYIDSIRKEDDGTPTFYGWMIAALFRRTILTYHRHDERVGCWTRVTFEDEAVTFSIGRNHWAGVVVGSLFVSFIVGLVSRTWFNSNLAFLVVFLLSAGPCFVLLRSRHSRHYSHFQSYSVLEKQRRLTVRAYLFRI